MKIRFWTEQELFERDKEEHRKQVKFMQSLLQTNPVVEGRMLRKPMTVAELKEELNADLVLHKDQLWLINRRRLISAEGTIDITKGVPKKITLYTRRKKCQH